MYIRIVYFLALLLCASGALRAQPQLQLQDFATGFVRPVTIEHAGDSRLFVMEQRGLIWIVDTLGNKSAEAFLNIDPSVRSNGNEQGLLGLAFHPDYATNGYFYLYYTSEPSGNTRVSRFTRDSLNSDKADPNSELVLLNQTQPYTNHNGGCIRFGPDGYLYISLGDGGSGGDPQANGQNKTVFLGKLLRIDVDGPNGTYAIPPDNPFANNPAYAPEIWSLGWRNPWRYSFDRLTGDLWVGDVGQNAWEEIDFQANGNGGENYGWRCYEGNHPYNTSGCQASSAYASPVFDYPNPAKGCSVTGGYVYRGSKYSDLYGLYIFTDYCSGRWWTIQHNADNTFTTTEIADLANNEYSTLGQDVNGELYVALLASGKIQKITERCSAFQLSADITNAYCNGSFSGIIQLHTSGAVGDVSYFWSNGQSDSLIVYLNPGPYTVIAQNGNGCERSATFTVGADTTIAAPTLLNIPPSNILTLCPGASITLDASAATTGLEHVWFRNGQIIAGAVNASLSVTAPGAYTVSFKDLACFSDTAASVQVQNATQTTPTLSIQSGSNLLCPGDTALLQSSPAPAGQTYQWYIDGNPIAGAEAQNLSVYQSGAYSVGLVGPCGVIESAPLAIEIETVPIPYFGQQNDTLFAMPGWAAYQWYYNGALVPGATGDALHLLGAGDYLCAFTSANGCVYTTSGQISSSVSQLPENITAFSLSPNPTDGKMWLKMDLTAKERINIRLSDTNNNLIFQQSFQKQHVEKEIDLHGLPAGAYFLNIHTEQSDFTRAVIKL